MQTPSSPVRPWWQEPYVWMVIGGPLSAVIACLVTAFYIYRGPDRVVPEESYAQSQVIRREIQQAPNPLQPAQVVRNHSATGGPKHAQP